VKYAIVNYSNSGATLNVGMTIKEAKHQCSEIIRAYTALFNSPLVVNVRWTSDVDVEATVMDNRRVVDRLALGVVTQRSPEWVSLRRQANTHVETIHKTLNELWEADDEAAIVAMRKLNHILEEFVGELVWAQHPQGSLPWLPAEEAADDADGQE